MANIVIAPFLSFFLFGVASVVLISCGGLYYYRGRQKEEFNEKLIMYGFSCLFIFTALARIIFSVSETINYDPLINSQNEITYHLFTILARIYFILQLLGITLFIYAFEKIIKRTKFIFTIINIVLLTILTIGPNELISYLFSSIILYYDGILVFLIIILIIKWAQFEFKAISSFLLLGFTLIILGMLLYVSFLRDKEDFFYYIPPILIILGSLISLSPIVINPKSNLETSLHWILICCLSIGLVVFIEIYFLLNLETIRVDFIFNSTFFLILLVITFIYIIKIIRKEKAFQDKQKPIDILQMFTKPPRLTKEEVLLNREKKICLTCKNKLSRLLYLCPSCEALYCVKCSEALSNLENACWVCGTPFDESKPVKLSEEKEITIEENVKKDKDSMNGNLKP